MNNSKTSDYLCVHIKKGVFFMLFFTWSLTAQNLDFGKWNMFIENYSIEKNQEIGCDKLFFLVNSKEFLLNTGPLQKGDSIYRVLDVSHFILKSTHDRMALYSKIKYIPANNLWKLAVVHSADRDILQLFSIKTSNVSLLIENLKLDGIKITDQNDYAIIIEASLNVVIEKLLPMEHISYVSNECLRPVQESVVKDLDLSVNRIFNVQQLYPELNGRGQTIGLKDNLPNANDN